MVYRFPGITVAQLREVRRIPAVDQEIISFTLQFERYMRGKGNGDKMWRRR